MQVNNSVTTNVIVPILETERLCLRGFAAQDVDDYFAMVSDSEVVRYVGQGIPLNQEQSWQSLAFLIGHWQLTGFGLWAVEEKASGQVIGRVGLYQPPSWPGLELGWMLAQSHWQQGFAFEATQAVLTWCQEQPDKQKLISLIHPENKPSIKLARKLGARFANSLNVGGIDALEFAFDLQKSSGTLNAK